MVKVKGVGEYMVRNPVYDKARYYFRQVAEAGLPELQAYVHTAFYLRWIIENRLYSTDFAEESGEDIIRVRRGALSALELYQNWDGVFEDVMLSEDGNAFSQMYFDFNDGQFARDYATLAKGLPSLYHVEWNAVNYAKLKKLIDTSYREWKSEGPWWTFWRKRRS